MGNLFLEKVDLVEEENEGGVLEPVRVGDGFPEHEGFLHLVLEKVSILSPRQSVSTYSIFIFC